MKELGEKVAASDREKIEAASKALKEALGGEDAAAIKRATEALIQASHKLAEEVYKNTQAKAHGPAPTPQGQDTETAGKGGGKDDKIVDADFNVKDEK